MPALISTHAAIVGITAVEAMAIVDVAVNVVVDVGIVVDMVRTVIATERWIDCWLITALHISLLMLLLLHVWSNGHLLKATRRSSHFSCWKLWHL